MTDKCTCPACMSADVTDLLSAQDHLVSGETFTIGRCNSCSLAFTVDPPPENEIGHYYGSDDYISHSDRNRSLTDIVYHMARRFMLGRKYRLTSGVAGKRQGALLDVGSGTGYFASFMQERGWTVTGIELDDRAREYSIDKFRINALPPAEIKSIGDRSVDTVTFWHVLEHLYSPSEWMTEVKRILKDEGRCIIALPNIDSADAWWFGSRWAALDVPRHLWHFSPSAFVTFASNNGFGCERIISLPLDIFYISILSYKNSRRRFAFLRGMATAAVLATGSLFSKYRASSLIYVISKRA